MLVRKADAWKIVPASLLLLKPTEGDVEIGRGVERLRAMTKALSEVRAKVGQPGYSLEKTLSELKKPVAKRGG